MHGSLLLAFLLSQFAFIILLNFVSSDLLEAYGINEPEKNNTNINFEKLVIEYLNWWANVPFEEDPQQLDTPCVIHSSGSFIYLHDPFEMGNIKNTCTIPQKSLFFPFPCWKNPIFGPKWSFFLVSPPPPPLPECQKWHFFAILGGVRFPGGAKNGTLQNQCFGTSFFDMSKNRCRGTEKNHFFQTSFFFIRTTKFFFHPNDKKNLLLPKKLSSHQKKIACRLVSENRVKDQVLSRYLALYR